MRYVIRLHFPASNNMAKYEALLSGLRIAIELGVKRLDVHGDSQLVVDQVMKESSCHDPKMKAYCNAVRRLEDKFDGLELNHVPRKYNEDADELAKIASGRTTVPRNIFARDITKPSVEFKDAAEPGPSTAGPSGGNPPADEAEPMDIDFETSSADEAEAMEIDEASTSQDWRAQYLDWMIRGVLPSNCAQARRLARRAKSFILIDHELYKCSPSGVSQRCIPIPEGKELIHDIHAGTCISTWFLLAHCGRRRHRRRADLRGLPVLRSKDAPPGPRSADHPHHVAVCCVGTRPRWSAKKTPGGYTHLLVAVDKFSKWIEARPIGKIKYEQAVLFFTDIVFRFGVPNSIITDNGTQFTGKKFLAFCDDYHIRVDWSAVAHPQTNDQVECADGMIL